VTGVGVPAALEEHDDSEGKGEEQGRRQKDEG
jgi:hypothetical protein